MISTLVLACLLVGADAEASQTRCADLGEPSKPVQAIVEERLDAGREYLDSVTVTAWPNEHLMIPDYTRVFRLPPFIGVVSGGSAGSPSFDEVTQRYWWE